jgi:predicted Zn-dependent protease
MRSWITMALVVGVSGVLVGGGGRASTVTPGAEPPSRRAAEVRDQDIAFYEARAARDPFGARDRAMLAALYLDRSRAAGSEGDLRRAESLARASLGTRHARNDGAAAVLTSALMAQHRFPEAYDLAAARLAADPTDAITRATLGEIALELGRYAEADRLFGTLALLRYTAAVGPRYARWLELSGRSGDARELLQSLRDSLATGFRTTPDQMAWFDLRLGELGAHHGRPDLARAAFGRALASVPEDPRVMVALGTLELRTGHPARARDLGTRALGQRLDPAALILLAEAAEAVDDSAAAEQYARALDVAVWHAGSGFHRAWGLFLLDHGRGIAELRARATAELGRRRDVHGLDLAAWAAFRAGDAAAAAPLVDEALQRGVEDATLLYHGGRIALATGDTATARRRLKEALAVDPAFHHRQAAEARSLLAALGHR